MIFSSEERPVKALSVSHFQASCNSWYVYENGEQVSKGKFNPKVTYPTVAADLTDREKTVWQGFYKGINNSLVEYAD